jgi:hypothetical protein
VSLGRDGVEDIGIATVYVGVLLVATFILDDQGPKDYCDE